MVYEYGARAQIWDRLQGAVNLVLQLRNSGSGTRPNGSRAARDWGGNDPTEAV